MNAISLAVNQVMEGDCLEVLKQFQDNSVDLIVTSPPYADARKKDYGGCSPATYIDWFLPRSQELYRVLNPHGSFILNIKEKCDNGERSTYVIELVLALKKQGWLWIEEYIWHKKNCFPGKFPNRFRDAWEHVYHFTKSRDFQMYKDAVKVPPKPSTVKRLENVSELDKLHSVSKTNSGLNRSFESLAATCLADVYPTNVLHLPTETGNKGHSACYPVALPSFFIKLLTKNADVVLDPFSGSGTTLLAAKQLGRQYYGIELNHGYAEESRQKLNGYRIIDQFVSGVCYS